MPTLNTPTFAAFVLALAAVGCDRVATVEVPEPATIGAEVAVAGGTVRGVADQDGLKQYHGIPYAAPPVGDRRWAPPAMVESWTGVRDATSPGPGCVQQGAQGGFYDTATAVATMDEDCLTLNVWTRAEQPDDALPVMVWIHGGGLTVGSGDALPGRSAHREGRRARDHQLPPGALRLPRASRIERRDRKRRVGQPGNP